MVVSAAISPKKLLKRFTLHNFEGKGGTRGQALKLLSPHTSVQVVLVPYCCLFYVLSVKMLNVSIDIFS